MNGYFYLSFNANSLRNLVPGQHQAMIADMKTGRKVEMEKKAKPILCGLTTARSHLFVCRPARKALIAYRVNRAVSKSTCTAKGPHWN